MKILITGFKPWGILWSNPSEVLVKYLSERFPFEDTLVMEVSQKGLGKLESKDLESYDFIFMMGYGAGFRIETKALLSKSNFASKIKRKTCINTKENIGDFYCARAYERALKRNPNTIFIHVGFEKVSWLGNKETQQEKVLKIFKECTDNVGVS
jgi:hypothetical protein